MALAMLVIPIVDGIAKYLSSDYSPMFISWARYVVACLLIVPLSIARYKSDFLPKTQLGAHLFRTFCLVTAMTLYFVSISLIPMATAASAFFISPIIATVLAVIFLGERLTIWKTLALSLGFAGVLFIVKPGSSLQPGVLLALLSGLMFAIYMIATRVASRASNPIKTLTFQCLFGALLLTPQAIWNWKLPTVEYYSLFFALGLLSVVSHLLSIAAFRYAEASQLSPLIYLELVGTVMIGYLVFNNVPSMDVFAGAAMIIGGGLLATLHSSERA